MTNKRVVELAEINDVSCEVRQRRWNWLGHILRREGDNDCFTALGWTPEGRRARGRQKTTWRTVKRERNKAGWKSWEAAKTRQKVLVRQGGGLMRLLALSDLMVMSKREAKIKNRTELFCVRQVYFTKSFQ